MDMPQNMKGGETVITDKKTSKSFTDKLISSNKKIKNCTEGWVIRRNTAVFDFSGVNFKQLGTK